ncbi:MAG TPA: LysR substrate-binding domain-containing protein [Candidatus Binatia bacterium]|nr:LysR substrate-binding domain-containing protein [Candidatus Binatia bacterium]
MSIVPEPCIAQEIKNDTLKAIQFTDEVVMRPLEIISKQGRRFSPAVHEFVEFLMERTTLRDVAGRPDRALQATA